MVLNGSRRAESGTGIDAFGAFLRAGLGFARPLLVRRARPMPQPISRG